MRVFSLLLLLPDESPGDEVDRIRRIVSTLLGGVTLENCPPRGKFRSKDLRALTAQGASGMARWGDMPVLEIDVEPAPDPPIPGGKVH